MDLVSKNTIVIACAPGLNHALSHELEGLGFSIERSDPKAVSVTGTFEDAMQLNYQLRCANRILWPVTSFRAVHPNHLYKNSANFPWEEVIPENGYFSIDSFVQNQYIRDTRFANLKLKDAIVDRFTEKLGKRPNSGPDKSQVVVFMRWIDEKVDLFIDTSGNTIAKHGYRKLPGPAPLMENLAAGILQESCWNASIHFINPMCGSGTLAIEAALMALKIYPGTFRKNYGFQHLKNYNSKTWFDIRDKLAAGRASSTLNFRIVASDISRKAVNNARENAKYAGVDHLIDFKVCAFADTEIPASGGVVMLNPEYGQRLGEISALEHTYKEIGDFFKQKCSGYMGYIFTGNLELAKKVGLRTKRRMPFYNGKIECRLLEYELY